MRKALIVAISALLTFASVFSRADDLVIERDVTLKASAGVMTSEVCLHNVVEEFWVQGRCAVDREKCCKWNMGGENKAVITKADIQKETSKMQFGNIRMKLAGADQVEVQRTHRELTQTEIEERVLTNISFKMGEERTKFTVHTQKINRPIFTPINTNREWDVLLPDTITETFQAKILSGDETIGYVNASVRVEDEVFIAKRTIKPGEAIRGEDFAYKKASVSIPTLLSKQLFKKENFPEGLRSKQTIQAGAPLLGAGLERTPVVKLGDNVTLILRSDNLRVSTKGVIQGAAAIGDMVTVQLSKYNRTFRGRLVDNKLVEVWL